MRGRREVRQQPSCNINNQSLSSSKKPATAEEKKKGGWNLVQRTRKKVFTKKKAGIDIKGRRTR